ncbi:MAG: hypothetical protein P0Y60_01355 [Candidatus Microbacterium colombiense]|nr:MAG: hypothetical protein P0Y60_01355 [Microbacterium sp.]
MPHRLRNALRLAVPALVLSLSGVAAPAAAGAADLQDDFAATQPVRTNWWVLAVFACAAVLAIFTPWVAVVHIALVGFASFRLMRRPPRLEATMLMIAIALLVVSFTVIVMTGALALGLESTQSGTSVQLP